MLRQLLKKNTSWSMVGEIWFKGITLLTTIMIARSLGDELFGVYTFILATLQLLQILIDFGLPLVIVRDLNQHITNTKQYIGSLLSLKLVLALLSLGGLWIVAQFINKPQDVIRLLYVQGIFVTLYSFNTFLVALFRAKEHFKYEALIKIIDGIILLALVTWAVTVGTVAAIVFAFLAMMILSVLITTLAIGKVYFWPIFTFDTTIIRTTLKQAWPLALANMFVIVYFRIDAVMLSLMHGDIATGWYNAAYQLLYTLIFIPAFAMVSFFPKMSQLVNTARDDFKKLYKQSFLFMFVLATVLMGCVFIASEKIILIAYGEAFIESVSVMKILTLGVFMSFLAHVWLFTLTALKQQAIYTWAVGIGMGMNILLNVIFIPKYSLYAAAWTTVATEVLTGLIIFVACQRSLFSKKITLS